MKTIRIAAFAAAAALAVTIGGTWAQSDSEKSVGDLPVIAEMDIHVTEMAEKLMGKYLDESHMSVLKTVAYQHAIARNCDGFDLDENRYREEMGYALEPLNALPEEQQNDANIIAMMGYGAILGGQYAIAAYDYGAYCAHAEDDYSSVEGDNDEHVILVKN